MKKILFILTEIASPPRIFPFVVDSLGIKNSRLRAECLQILLAIIDSNGLSGTSTPGVGLFMNEDFSFLICLSLLKWTSSVFLCFRSCKNQNFSRIFIFIQFVLQPSLKAIAACISDRDSNVRNAALNAVVAAYKEAGDVVFQLIGKLSDKDQAMLEERIKRSGAVPKNKGYFEGNLHRFRTRFCFFTQNSFF